MSDYSNQALHAEIVETLCTLHRLMCVVAGMAGHGGFPLPHAEEILGLLSETEQRLVALGEPIEIQIIPAGHTER